MLGRHVLSGQGSGSGGNYAAAARTYLASTEAQQLRLSDVLLLAADLQVHAQHAGAGAALLDDEAALSAAMFSPVGTISDMLSGHDLFFTGHDEAVSNLTAADAACIRLKEVAGLQSAYRRRIEVAASPIAV